MAEGPTYPVSVDGVGDFIVARRTMRLQVKMDVEITRLTEGAAVDEFLGTFVNCLAGVLALVVEGPPGWSPDNADPWDDEAYARIIKVWGAIRDKEEMFRGRAKAAG